MDAVFQAAADFLDDIDVLFCPLLTHTHILKVKNINNLNELWFNLSAFCDVFKETKHKSVCCLKTVLIFFKKVI